MENQSENQIITQAKSEIKKLSALKAELDLIGTNCQQISVKDEISLAIAQNNLSKANNMRKILEDKRKEIKNPYKEAGELVDSTAKLLLAEIDKGISHVKSQISDWEAKRKEEERKKQEDLNRKLEFNQITPEAAKEISVQISQVSSASKARGVREKWDFEVADISKVPLEWLTINEAAINQYMKDSKDSLKENEVINGIKFYKKTIITA